MRNLRSPTLSAVPFALALVMAIASVTAGCDDGPIPEPPARTSPTTTPGTPPAPTTPEKPARSLVTARAMGTRADNLVLDPTFGSANATYSVALLSDGASLSVEAMPTSPAGLSQNVLRVTPEVERPAVVLAVQGGADAVDASVWIAAPKGASPSAYLSSADGRDVYELEEAKGSDQVHGDRTYVRYAARMTRPIYGKLYLVVETSGKTPTAIAAPDVAIVSKIAKRAEARQVTLSKTAARAVLRLATKPIVPGPTRPELQEMATSAGRISPRPL